jgi:hypothetical protein
MIRRWCLTKTSGAAPAVQAHAEEFSLRPLREGIWQVCTAEFTAAGLRAAQADADVVVLPGLEAPAGRLPAAVLALLGQRGVVLAADDRVLDALRKWRNARGLSVASLDIQS